jgi:hypothetical protein
METKALLNCGINEIKGLQQSSFDPEACFKWMCKVFKYNEKANLKGKDRLHCGRGYYIFSMSYHISEIDKKVRHDWREHDYGIPERTARRLGNKNVRALRKYINENKLGTLRAMPAAGNPNYHNKREIIMYVYTPDNQAICDLSVAKGWASPAPNTGHLGWWINSQ